MNGLWIWLRAAFLYLRGSLGAVQVDGGWHVPRRRRNATWLVMRVHDWLVSHGYSVDAEGIANSAIAQELEAPVRYIGIGEGIDDIQEFEAGAFAEALLE